MARTFGLAAILALATATLPSLAAEKAPRCFSNDRYFVIERERENDGRDRTDILVRTKGTSENPPCIYKPAEGDFQPTGEDDVFYVWALKGNYLIITDDLGFYPGLVIFNLDSRRQILGVGLGQGSDDVLTNERITFWMRTDEKATLSNCDQYEEIEKRQMGATIERRVTFYFASERLYKSDLTRCVQTM